jgi:ABC-type nitrate/sulfonate/bicarbonate transport system substrate-binding protein
MSTYLHRSITAGFFVVTAFGLGFSSVASAAEVANTLRYGINNEQNINRLPQVIAEREGFFAREGLNVEIVTLTAPGPTVREALANGGVDMVRRQLPLFIHAAITGEVTSIGVGLGLSNTVYFLVARPEIESFADLKGKTVAVTVAPDGITLWTRKLLELHGLKNNERSFYNEDVETIRVIGSAGRLACLQSGECDAAPLTWPVAFEQLDAGYHILGITNEIEPLFYQLDIVNPSWAAAHRDLVEKYIRATTAAKRFIHDPENRDEVVAVTMDYMQQPENSTRQILSYIWDPQNRVLVQQAEIDVDNVRETISLMAEYGVLAQPMPEHFVDTSYAEEADQ